MDDPQTERGLGLRPIGRELARIEARAMSAGRFGLTPPWSSSLGAVAICPTCGEERMLRETIPNVMGRAIRYWSECTCVVAASERARAISENATEAIRGSRDEAGQGDLAAYEVEALERAQALTLDRFDPALLGDPTPYHMAVGWLREISEQSSIGSYRVGPPAALYFCGPPGRGKTHLAVALLLAAKKLGRRVAIVNEKKYLHQSRSVPFGPQLEALVATPGERSWLTLIDDIGKQKVETDAARAFVQGAWYNVIDRRYNARRWALFTSEHTLDQLLDQGTLDSALYSRIYEMTRGAQLLLTGDDQRLRGGGR